MHVEFDIDIVHGVEEVVPIESFLESLLKWYWGNNYCWFNFLFRSSLQPWPHLRSIPFLLRFRCFLWINPTRSILSWNCFIWCLQRNSHRRPTQHAYLRFKLFLRSFRRFCYLTLLLALYFSRKGWFNWFYRSVICGNWGLY